MGIHKRRGRRWKSTIDLPVALLLGEQHAQARVLHQNYPQFTNCAAILRGWLLRITYFLCTSVDFKRADNPNVRSAVSGTYVATNA